MSSYCYKPIIELINMMLAPNYWKGVDSVNKLEGFQPKQGRSQTFSLGGVTGGAVLQQGELSMVCVGLSERDLLRL